MFPCARVGDACISPLGIPGRIIAGSPTISIDGLPAARLGDAVLYANGTATTIAEGEPSFTLDGLPAALVGHRLADGGRIVGGSPDTFAGKPAAGAGTPQAETMRAARREGLAFTRAECNPGGPAPDAEAGPPAPEPEPAG